MRSPVQMLRLDVDAVDGAGVGCNALTYMPTPQPSTSARPIRPPGGTLAPLRIMVSRRS
ncbi:MAG: hypothetical protein R2854_09235 [Caldilineaceae bacterium]